MLLGRPPAPVGRTSNKKLAPLDTCLYTASAPRPAAQRPAHIHPRPPMTSSEIAMPGEVKADPAALMASLQLLPSPTPNLEIKYTKVKPGPRTLSRSFLWISSEVREG